MVAKAEVSVVDLADKLTSHSSMMASWLQNCEAEVMVDQTIRACKLNLEKRGEAFSIRGNVFSYGGGTNNASAYRRLLREGYFTEEERDIDGETKTVIFPTRKLLLAVAHHLEK